MDFLAANLFQILGVLAAVSAAVVGFFRKFAKLESRLEQLERDLNRVENDLEKQLAEIKLELSGIRETISEIFKLMISNNK